MNKINDQELLNFITNALHEDIQDGDHTSLACVPKGAIGKAKLLVKDEGILAGVALAKKIFQHVDPDFEIEIFIEDGTPVKYGDIAFEVRGKSQAILKTERLVLNAMQRMSGIATMSRQFVDAVDGLNVQILDTRKTTPLLRFLEKWAVRIGGATNYRTGLYDRIMIKDNHIDFCGTITKAVNQTQAYLKEQHLDLEITLEVRDMQELQEALEVGQINRIMLDNFDTDTMRKAVALIDGRFEVEASGGITLETVRAYAETGVDFISVGALTHSFRSMDLSLKKK
ncbi:MULTISPECIES: carboxylating nicotinate-nucleotide diphosphorylase [unclassified Aureispira]|uniref:carboxylating nicotinate-nucleotide diphosphorylase n=1 Tax=unclassified Aureispira TaxID=2649989 RepID=UPI000696A26F|nr:MULTISPECIES: carboxylating nicotinate-nucleotide diphosphorylase [unclassified Aureispira]WMX16428.1 carboxylating nicotinate-nucleotide diphosphorylase [Aureispira sp. CCB-E]